MTESGWVIGAIARRALTTALSAPALLTGTAVEAETARLLEEVIPCDRVIHTEIRLGGSARLRIGPDLSQDRPWEDALASHVAEHPAVTSYLHAGDDGKPRRVTDVIDQRTWCNSAVFADVFRDRGGRYQLSLVTSLDHGVGKGWVLLRDKRDFSLADLQTANLVLPQVVCLAEMAKLKSQLIPRQPRVGQSQQLEFKNHGSPNAPHQGDTARHPPTQAPWPPWLDKSLARAAKPTSLELLTARERVVFEALASGASARQISRELGITETTTRKHLQHIYAKLGVHDRLSAVLAHPARLDSDPKII